MLSAERKGKTRYQQYQNESAIQYCVLSFDLSAKPLEILITDLELSFLVRSENTCMHSISNELQWLGQRKKDAEMMKSWDLVKISFKYYLKYEQSLM